MKRRRKAISIAKRLFTCPVGANKSQLSSSSSSSSRSALAGLADVVLGVLAVYV